MGVVGYEQHRARLRRLVDETAAGAGGAVALSGAAGVGKSTLLAEAVDSADGAAVIETRGVQPERTVPFATLHALFAGIDDPTAGLPDPQRQALGVALALTEGPVPDRLTLSVAVHTRLAGLAPALVVVDDLQWVDSSSRDLVAFVAHRAAPAGLGVLVAHRPDPRLEAPLAGLASVQLDGVGPDAARAILSAEAGLEVNPAVAQRLHREAAGNPLVLAELARATPSQVLTGRTPMVAGPLPLRAEVEDRYAARIRDLPADTRLAVLVAAACARDDRVVLDEVLDGLGLDPTAWQPAVGGVLVDADRRVVFAHPLVRAAAYRVAPIEDRQRVHRMLAKVIDAEPARRVWHLIRAAEGADDVLADEVAAVAAQAARRGGRAEAASLFEDAAGLSPDTGRAAASRLEAARHWHFGGHLPRAADLLDELLAGDALDPAGWLDAQLLRGQVDLWRGEIPRALDNLTGAAERADDPLAAAILASSASVGAIMSGDIPRAVQLADGAHATLTAAGHPMAPLAACALAEAVLLAGDTDRGLALLDGLGTGWGVEQVGIDSTVLLGAFVVAHALGLAGRWQDSRRQLEKLIDLARQGGALAVLELPLPNLADLHHRFGNLHTARGLVDEALEIATFTGNLTDRAHALSIQARIEAAAGDQDACLDAVDTILAGAGRHGWHALATYAHHARGHLALGLGQPEDAIADLQTAGRLEAAHGVVDPLVVPYGPDLVEALARTGRTDEATAALDDLAGAVERTGSCWGAGVVARCRGLLDDDPDQLEQSIVLLDQAGAHLDVLRARLCLGQVLRRRQQRAAARDQLRTAADELARGGAAGWAAQATRELRATGGRTRPTQRSPDGPAVELTEREQAIADLVASGATNREVAAQLYLSPKTVENHLTRMYAKLAVRSRTELGELLRDQ